MSREALLAEERYVDFAGRSVRVRVHGQGSPLLLINGLGANVSTWSPLLEQLNGFEVITFDAPGTGRSAAPYTPYAISRVAEVARVVLDDVGHERADVLGYSLGGAVAQHLAFSEPERVRRLTLVSSSCGVGGLPGSLPALLAVSTPLRHYTKSGYRAAMRLINLALAEKERGVVDRHIAAWHQEPAPSMIGYMLQMTAFSTFNSLPWLHRVSQPTLVLSGEQDRLMPVANSAILASRLPNARLRVFEHWGHYLLHDPESGAGATVASFLRAPNYRRSAAWRGARTVTEQDAAELIRATPRSAHPARVTSGLVRRWSPRPDGTV